MFDGNYCSQCNHWYEEPRAIHLLRNCPFVNGCEHCRKMYVNQRHVDECGRRLVDRANSVIEIILGPPPVDNRPIPVQVMESGWWKRPVHEGIKIVDERKRE